jgi:sugar/nucleoside kinase (ribokinase family)/nucleoside-diphosphate-sugar epimerase
MSVLTVGETMALLDPVGDGPLDAGRALTLRIAGAESNLAVALVRLGVDVTWVSAVGADAYGDVIERTLSAEGVRVLARRDPARPTGLFTKWREGGRSHVLYHRHGSAASALRPEDVPDELLEGVELVHLTGITTALGAAPRALVHDLARRADERGATVLFDPNWRPALWPSPAEAAAAHRDLLPHVDWYLCGAEEGRLLWETDDPAAVVREAGAGNAVVRLGERGAVLDGEVVPPSRVTDVLDEIGAGDGFAAGFAWGILRGLPPRECVRAANAIAAAALAGTGDWETFPTLPEIEHEMPERKFRHSRGDPDQAGHPRSPAARNSVTCRRRARRAGAVSGSSSGSPEFAFRHPVDRRRCMKVLVTGAHGKVGRALVPRLMEAGHDVRASDLTRPVWDRVDLGEPTDYVQADLTDAGAAYALAKGCEIVIHTAAIPQPIHNAPHVVFENNLMSTFNVLEAAIAFGAKRFVNFSSETVPGFIFAHRPFKPDYLPVDEEHQIRPQDPYATAKWFSELLCERAVERADIRCTSIRPCWVQDEGSYERNLGPIVRDPSVIIENYVSYIDVHDLCDAVVLAIETDLPGHEVFYIASPDTIGGHPLVETVRRYYDGEDIPFRPLEREDASAISSAKARRLLGWEPKRSWRDYLDENGRAKT